MLTDLSHDSNPQRIAEYADGPRRQLFAVSNTIEGADHGHILGQTAANTPPAAPARAKQRKDSPQVEDSSGREGRDKERCAVFAFRDCARFEGGSWVTPRALHLQAAMGGEHVPCGDPEGGGSTAQVGRRPGPAQEARKTLLCWDVQHMPAWALVCGQLE